MKTKKHLAEKTVVEYVFSAYKHPRYKRKPHDASIKAAIHREFRKLKGTNAPKRKGRVVRGKAGEGRTFNPNDPYHYPPTEAPDPYGYGKIHARMAKDFFKKDDKHPLGGLNDLAQKTDTALELAKEQMEDLIRKQDELVERIRKLQDKKAKIDSFKNSKETIEILALLRQ